MKQDGEEITRVHLLAWGGGGEDWKEKEDRHLEDIYI
jgi:hypothetical protein